MMIFLTNYIKGVHASPAEGAYLKVFDPSTGQVFSQVPDSSEVDLLKAIESAHQAFPCWAATPTLERAKYLRKIAAKIEARKEEFALAESQDTGKPLSTANQVDIFRSIRNLEFFADAITQFSSESHLTDQTAINYTLRSPLGVVACISPWNLPLYLLTWKIAPALAAGNTVVAKPSEVTPYTATLLSQVCAEVELPPGVLNIVHGLGSKLGPLLTRHPKIAAISFTGSTATGSEIAKNASPLFKKLSLEMGGKNPTLVFADADFHEAVEGVVRSAFTNQGQICLCGSRVFIERSIYPRFKSAVIERTRALKVGDPLEATTDQGAVVSQAHYQKILSYLELAKNEGGEILTGAHPIHLSGRCQKGWFIAPTLLEGLAFNCRTNQEEIFGPVATLTPFDSEAEVVQWANSTAYGLSASIWTTQIKRAHRISSLLNCGMVWVNCWMLRDLRTPFGGIGASGVGREGGVDSLRFFTDSKNVCFKF